MQTKVISRSELEQLQLSEIRDHCRIDDDYDNELIDIYTQAAIDIAEKQTNRMLTPSVIDAYVPEFREKIFLPYGNVSEIIEVRGVNSSGIEELITDYKFNDIDESLNLNPSLSPSYSDIKIRYKCGYESGSVPHAILQGILVTIATFYNVREDVSYGVQAFEVPMTSRWLFNLYRISAGGLHDD